jgi:MFS transporter, DHA1 family, inner membrane transport protein
MSSSSPTARAAREAADAPLPWALLAALCLGSFVTTASGSARAPFLIDMARDLATTLPLVANIVGLTSITWGTASFLAGTASDRFGRRPFLIGGPIALALALAGVASAETLLGVAVWSTVAGFCCGLYTGVTFAEVAARVHDRQRGRAIGWVMSGQSLSLLIGVPLAAWIGAGIGWRGVNLCLAALAMVVAIGSGFTASRPVASATGAGTKSPSLRQALTRPVLRLLASVVAERICFGLAAVYFATFLQSTYSIGLEAVALPLAIFASGNILGTILGGQIADRWHNRMLTFALAMIASGIVALALFVWPASLAISVGLGFAYVMCNALARPSLMAALANVPAEVRGTVLGLNGTSASLGWLGAAALGGWMLGTTGFAGFGPLAFVLALAGAGLALIRSPIKSTGRA